MISKALTRFLKDDSPPTQATSEALEAFGTLKQSLLLAPIVQTPNWVDPVFVFTDASGEGVGATLAQLDTEEYDHPIYYASRKLTFAKMNYIVIEQEGLGVIFRLKKFCHYLLRLSTTMMIDHQVFIYLLNKTIRHRKYCMVYHFTSRI